jgi:hypothetical protein
VNGLPSALKPWLIAADGDLLVVNKPSGLLCQPGLGPALADSLLTRLRCTWPSAQLVHRLDRDTSGLLLLALTPELHRALSGLFAQRLVHKTYRADVAGVAVPGDPVALLEALKPHLAPDAVVVVSLDQMARGRPVKDAMQRIWRQVLPYREHAPSPVLFLLASDQRFGATLRPFPPNLQRLNPRYLQSLFSLAKDEYDLLYGPPVAGASAPPVMR